MSVSGFSIWTVVVANGISYWIIIKKRGMVDCIVGNFACIDAMCQQVCTTCKIFSRVVEFSCIRPEHSDVFNGFDDNLPEKIHVTLIRGLAVRVPL